VNGFLLLVPFLLLRFGLLAALDRDAVRRAAHFPPMHGGEVLAYLVYQLSTAALLIAPLFLQVSVAPSPLFLTGGVVYGVGLLLCAASMVQFASPAAGGFHDSGLYRFSRHPMYVSYFLVFLGCALLTRSPLLLAAVLAFQVSAHWIILAEERWCREVFGAPYQNYMNRVRRYI